MKNLLLVALLFVSCGPKLYTKVEIGMPFNDFHKLCNVDGHSLGMANTVTNANGSTMTVTLEPTPYPFDKAPTTPRPNECIGKFTFVDGELTSIAR